MDPNWAKQLLETVCQELGETKERAKRALKPVGMGVALGLAMGGVLACGGEDVYGGPPLDDPTSESTDVYGVDTPTDPTEGGEDDPMPDSTDVYGVDLSLDPPGDATQTE